MVKESNLINEGEISENGFKPEHTFFQKTDKRASNCYSYKWYLIVILTAHW